MKGFLKIFSFVPALAMMYLIFSFSAQTGTDSSALSHKVAYKIVQVYEIVTDTEFSPDQVDHYVERLQYPVRKLAHMSEYFLLAICVSLPGYVYGLRGLPLLFVAGGICVAFAAGDEYHQSSVAGRGPSVKDVCIDSIGVFFGVTLVRIICWIALTPSRIAKRARRRARAKAREHR